MMEFTFDGIVRHGFGFYNPNHAAALICAVFPFLWGWKKYAWSGWILSLLLTIPLAMTYSRTGVLVLFFELAAYFILTKTGNWKLIAAVGAGMLLILTAFGIFGRFILDKAVTNRPEIWLTGLKLYAANPFGVGIGNSGLTVSNFMLNGIECRTLVSSHLTLLVEFGAIAGFFWFGLIFYALLNGGKKIRTWCAFSGTAVSAGCSSVFDWDLLRDFQNFGGLSLSNYLLSWLLLIVFLAMMIFLVSGRIDFKRLGISAGISLLCVSVPFLLWNSRTPKAEDGIVFTSPDSPLALYDENWNPKSALPYCGEEYRIPLKPGLFKRKADRVILFGNAAEFAPEFPGCKIIYVAPPEFFEP